MFWQKCGHLISEGKLLRCKDNLCSYILVIKCDGKEDGFDENWQCNLASAGKQIEVLKFADSCGKVLYRTDWFVLGEKYNRDEQHTYLSEFGTVFKRIGNYNFCSVTNGQNYLKKFSDEYWGEQAISTCNCCCFYPGEVEVIFTFDYFERETTRQTGSSALAVDITYTFSSSGSFRATLSNGSNNLANLSNVSGSAEAEYKNVQTSGQVLSNTCSFDIPGDGNPLNSIIFNISSDCKNWILQDVSSPFWYAFGNCYVNGSRSLGSLIEVNRPQSPKEYLYPTGSFQASSKTQTESTDGYFIWGNHQTIQVTLNITPIENARKIPEHYKEAYDSLSENLKF